MTLFGEAVRESQVRCLLKAQDSLARARSGFGLPDDVALELQRIMERIPAIIGRLESSVYQNVIVQERGCNHVG